MTKTNNKTAGNPGSNTTTLVSNSNPMVASKAYKPQGSGKVGKSDHTNKTVPPTHEQIAERAKLIWRQNGCPSGQDQTNWYEAEAQLKRELATK